MRVAVSYLQNSMNTKPSVSFVIPAFNASLTLKDAVTSIFAGNFSDGDEVIIVNDASTDSTSIVIQELVETFAPHIYSITNDHNKGCPATRNVGIQTAKNTLIFNLDADNILAPGSVRMLVNALISQAADMAAFSEYHYFIDSTKRITHYWYCIPGWLSLENFMAGHINPGPGGNFLYTKASWEQIGGYSEYGKGLHEAWGFTLKQLASGSKVFVVPDTFYFHRHGHESLFTTESRNKPGERELLQKMIADSSQLFPEEEITYMANHDWYHQLEIRPIRLFSNKVGKNGLMRYSLYGYWRKIVQKLRALLLQIVPR